MSGEAPSLFRIYLAGINDSEPLHWQSLWQRSDRSSVWIEHREWAEPDLGQWLQEMRSELRGLPSPTVLVAHSLGCYLAAAWLRTRDPSAETAAFLVAPPDLGSPRLQGRIHGFEGLLDTPLPGRGLLIASEDDPYCSLPEAEAIAARWRLPWIRAGALGHINLASGLGYWEQGRQYLEAFEAGARRPFALRSGSA